MTYLYLTNKEQSKFSKYLIDNITGSSKMTLEKLLTQINTDIKSKKIIIKKDGIPLGELDDTNKHIIKVIYNSLDTKHDIIGPADIKAIADVKDIQIGTIIKKLEKLHEKIKGA